MLNFFTKALLKSKLKSAGVPESEMEKLFTMIEKNPDFFKKMVEGIQAKVNAGMNQEQAAKQFAEENKDEMAKLLAK